MPASKLTAMAQRTAIRNLARIDDFTGIPYKAIKPILARIENPDHLHEIELKCEEIADNSAEFWQNFIIRDIPNGREKMLHPKNPRSWHKVYRKMMRDEERRKAEAEEALKNTMLGLAGQRKETQILNKIVPHKTRPKDFIDGVPNVKGSNSRVKYEGAHGSLNTIRRPASHWATQKVFQQKLTRNTIPDIKTQIRVAPKSMVREYNNAPSIAAQKAAEQARKYAEPKSQIQKVFAPTVKRSAADRAIDEAKWRQQQEREQRLRNLTTPGKKSLPSAAAQETRATSSTRPTTAASPPPRSSTSTPTTAQATVASRSSPSRRLPPIQGPSPPADAGSPVKNQAIPASSPSPAKSTPPPPMRRKRPAADPFMPATKRARP